VEVSGYDLSEEEIEKREEVEVEFEFEQFDDFWSELVEEQSRSSRVDQRAQKIAEEEVRWGVSVD
jgi:hypothetical protein